MSHFASADTDPAFTELQLERFLAATAPYAHLTRHIANSAATLRHPGVASRRGPLRDRASTASRPSAPTRPPTACGRRCAGSRPSRS